MSGLELVGLSFLGPFLAPSVFPEEDPGVAEKYFSQKIIPSELKTASKDLQQDLGKCFFPFPTSVADQRHFCADPDRFLVPYPDPFEFDYLSHFFSLILCTDYSGPI